MVFIYEWQRSLTCCTIGGIKPCIRPCLPNEWQHSRVIRGNTKWWMVSPRGHGVWSRLSVVGLSVAESANWRELTSTTLIQRISAVLSKISNKGPHTNCRLYMKTAILTNNPELLVLWISEPERQNLIALNKSHINLWATSYVCFSLSLV